MNAMDVALICKALGDANRLEIVQMLSDGEKCGCKLLERFEIIFIQDSHGIISSIKFRNSSLVIADEDGIEMRMSPLGIYFDRSAKDLEHSGIGNIVLYYSDGHETQINDIGVHTCSGDGQYTGILYTDHQLIDIENCTKVKIGERVFNAIG